MREQRTTLALSRQLWQPLSESHDASRDGASFLMSEQLSATVTMQEQRDKLLQAASDAIIAIEGLKVVNKGQRNCIPYAVNQLRMAIMHTGVETEATKGAQ